MSNSENHEGNQRCASGHRSPPACLLRPIIRWRAKDNCCNQTSESKLLSAILSEIGMFYQFTSRSPLSEWPTTRLSAPTMHLERLAHAGNKLPVESGCGEPSSWPLRCPRPSTGPQESVVQPRLC